MYFWKWKVLSHMNRKMNLVQTHTGLYLRRSHICVHSAAVDNAVHYTAQKQLRQFSVLFPWIWV